MKMLKVTAQHPVTCIIGIAYIFATAGIDIIIAADGTVRPQTKTALVMHAANKERDRIDSIKAKEDLANLY